MDLNPAKPGLGKQQRRLSIDVLRGLTVAFMILVNNAGDGAASYPQLRHSVWNGCTLTDLVFPMFLFIMGVSMAISFESRLKKQISRTTIAAQLIRRSAVIIFIGLALNALPVPHLSTLRFCGVMQRIGLCYFFTGLALLYLGIRGVTAAAVVGVIGYWLLLTKVPVPGFGFPGSTIPVLDPQGNLASYLDRLLIPQAHRYHMTFYDPEGLLSTLPAVATTCLGVLTGRWLSRPDVAPIRKLIAMAITGALLIAVGLVWSDTFPLNKRLWTSSYVLFTGGISLCTLTVLEWAIARKFLRNTRKTGTPGATGSSSVWRHGFVPFALLSNTRKTGTPGPPVSTGSSSVWRHGFVPFALLSNIILEPWLAFGGNALAAYVLSELLAILLDSFKVGASGTLQHYLYLLIPAALGPAAVRSLIWSILFVGVCFIPIFYLRRRGVTLKL